MYKLICKEIGFDCDFIVHNNDQKTLANDFKKHVRINHRLDYPKKDIFDFIAIQNTNLDNLESIKNEKSTCVDSCESFRLDKWQIGHRNFP